MSALSLNLDNIQATALPSFEFTGTTSSITDVVKNLLPYIFAIAGIILLLYIILGGLQLMFAGGDPKKIQASWTKITNAVIGFVIVFLSYWITQLFGELLNIQIIKDIFK